MWVNARRRMPKKDGCYMYQSIYGDVSSMNYTVKGGWNTHYEIGTHILYDEKRIEDGYIARWFEAPEPEPVPEEWFEEYWEGRSNES